MLRRMSLAFREFVLSSGSLAECCFDSGGVGAVVSLPQASGEGLDIREDIILAATLFGETASRVIVSVAEENLDAFFIRARQEGVPTRLVGQTGGTHLRVTVQDKVVLDQPVLEIEEMWASGLSRYFGGRAA